MRADDNIQEVVDINIKAAKLTMNTVLKAIRCFLNNAKEEKNLKVSVGKDSMNKLLATEKNVKFLPNELNKEDMKLIAKEFKKYKIHFAVEKVEENSYRIAFAGRNLDSIEHAMKQVAKKLEKRELNKDKGLHRVKELLKQVLENDKAEHEQKTRKREKSKNRER
jgi:hypothetical protein